MLMAGQMRRFGGSALMIVAVALAGCADTTVINSAEYYSSYWPGEQTYAGNRLHVQVVGDPFTPPPVTFDATVIDAMQHMGGPTEFTTGPSATHSPYFAVMLFNPGPTMTGERVCAAPDKVTQSQPPGPGTRLPLLAVLCRGTQYLSAASGTLSPASGPLDPKFRDDVRQFTLTLFPQFNPDGRNLPDSDLPI
jgi:hypothetical protein